jgi:hypothetical protein
MNFRVHRVWVTNLCAVHDFQPALSENFGHSLQYISEVYSINPSSCGRQIAVYALGKKMNLEVDVSECLLSPGSQGDINRGVGSLNAQYMCRTRLCVKQVAGRIPNVTSNPAVHESHLFPSPYNLCMLRITGFLLL